MPRGGGGPDRADRRSELLPAGPAGRGGFGREPAISPGVEYQRLLGQSLAVIAALVSISTTLVGPVAFLGLLVSHLACQFTGTFRHRYTVIAAGLIAVIALVGGQFILAEVFGSGTRLSVIITFVGGGYLILLLLQESRR